LENLDLEMQVADKSFWQGKRVLVTGHTGFKGSWLVAWLLKMGAKVSGFALPPEENPLSHFNLLSIESHMQSAFINLNDKTAVENFITEQQPEIIFHMAAQSLVRRSIAKPVDNFETNVQGTANVLDACLKCKSPPTCMIITSDKVYKNDGHGLPFKEDDKLGGKDPYSASKAMCELLVSSYRDTYFAKLQIPLISLRAGNVIGGGDFCADRLIPDYVRATQQDTPLIIRNPNAIRPWQHVLDCLNGYLIAAEMLHRKQKMPHALNIAPHSSHEIPAREVVEILRITMNGASVIEQQEPNTIEAQHLTIDATLARETLGWSTQWSQETAIQKTALWYNALLQDQDMKTVTSDQIDDILGSKH
jgi:CDP-glucose 4,6-dehydratase